MKAAIIGGGNIGMALAEGLIRANACKADDITITRRNPSSLTNLTQKGFSVSSNNAEAIKNANAFLFACCRNN
jgi:pyrroline-5-carboxylate reductase